MDEAAGLQLEEALAGWLYGGALDPSLRVRGAGSRPVTVASVQDMVLQRQYRGTGGLLTWYPKTIAAWQSANGGDPSLRQFAASFCASSACAAWREHPVSQRGLSLEEAFFRFFEERGVGSEAIREEELLAAVVRSLAVTPDAAFAWPEQVRATAAGCVAVSRSGALHAAVSGRYVCGPVTPLVAELIRGSSLAQVAEMFSVPAEQVRIVRDELSKRGLLG